MFVIFNLDIEILNPVVEAGEPVVAAISMKKKVKNYLEKAASFFQKGSSKHYLKLTLPLLWGGGQYHILGVFFKNNC